MSKLQRRRRQLLDKGYTPEAVKQVTKGIAKIMHENPKLNFSQARSAYLKGKKKTSRLGVGYDKMLEIFKKYNVKHKSGYEEYLEGVYSPEEYSNTVHEAAFDAWDVIEEYKKLATAELQKATTPDALIYWKDAIRSLDDDAATLEQYLNLKYY